VLISCTGVFCSSTAPILAAAVVHRAFAGRSVRLPHPLNSWLSALGSFRVPTMSTKAANGGPSFFLPILKRICTTRRIETDRWWTALSRWWADLEGRLSWVAIAMYSFVLPTSLRWRRSTSTLNVFSVCDRSHGGVSSAPTTATSNRRGDMNAAFVSDEHHFRNQPSN
jgi:hypothetical protein